MKVLAATFIMALLLSALAGTMHFGTVQAESSITKPSVPEFTVKLIDSSYDVPPTSSVDPYTGQTVTQAGYHVESRTIKLSIKNQPFTPFLVEDENGNNWTADFCYNIRIKGHFSEDWMELYRASEGGYPTQDSESEYTVLSFVGEYSSTKGMEFETSAIMTSFPPGAQIDFQVEAMIGYIHHVDAMPFSADVFEGETSGWSNTQTLTFPGNTSGTSPDGGTASDGGTQQIEPSSFILGVAVTAIVVVVGAGLLVYFKKHNYAKINKHSEIEQSSTLIYKRLLIMCFLEKIEIRS
jgi:hypothetical protein